MNSSHNSLTHQKFIRQVFETARFFWDMWEEGAQGDTRAIGHLLAQYKRVAVPIRNLVLGEFYQQQGQSLRDASFGLADWLTWHLDAPALDDAMGTELDTLCRGAARPFAAVQDAETKIQRSFVRLVRYLQQTRITGEGAHSRCFEHFIAAEHVPIGFGKNGNTYPEHVVPCAFLRDRCLIRLAEGASVEEVAQEIRPFLAIVMISPEEATYLDKSKGQGGLGLKDKMPDGWTFAEGDIFERLHIAGIKFESPIAPFSPGHN